MGISTVGCERRKNGANQSRETERSKRVSVVWAGENLGVGVKFD